MARIVLQLARVARGDPEKIREIAV